MNEQRFFKEVEELKSLLGSKSSAPKEQVYPKFAQLAQSYLQLLEERKNLEGFTRVFRQLMELKETMSFEIAQPVLSRLRNVQSPVLQKPEQLQNPHNLEIIMPDTNLEFMNISLAFLGFCTYNLVKNQGLLLPGKPSIGLVIYED